MWSKKLSFLAEDALVTVYHQTILRHLLEMGSTLLLVVRCNEYAIQIDKHRGDDSQDVIHQPLKHLSSIGETECHPQEFEQAKGGDDRHLVDVLRHHWNLVITFSKVNLGEDSASIQVGIKTLDRR